MEIPLKSRLFYFFPVLFCFCLPFGSLLLSGLIVLWILVSFFNIDVKQLRSGLRNKKLILLSSFFILTLISAFASANNKEATFSVEIKLTFLLFPYLFFCFTWPVEIIKRCVISFVSGCFFACIYLIIRASSYAFDSHPEYFFYTLFSYFIHASYFAMYLILAIVFVIVFYFDWFKTQKSVIYSSYFFILIFTVCIFLCSSKLGVISFFICMPLLLVYRIQKNLSIKKIAILLIVLISAGFVLVKTFPESFTRFNPLRTMSLENIDKSSSESTAVRVLIWREAIILIKDNFLFGTDVGDANDNLYEAYKKNGLTGAYKHRVNAHNQFLQTFIGLGLVGFVLLLFMTFGAAFKAVKEKRFVLFIFFLLIIMNFMVESMLQTSAGVLFFVFFSCFFDKISGKDINSAFENQSPEGKASIHI